ncbi:hypothetical protein [Enterococcus plantarum]|uniref:hypothetical protein n=1 Tax=Enterococcus plantarum TaxID=1077675 RepID=UPI001A8CFD01|nr:hypothetical protein [Enterococcus plantarum]MBO0422739.1 hypothetical protein [Enterococcus plantarum]
MPKLYVYHLREESTGNTVMKIFTNKVKAVKYFENEIQKFKTSLSDDDEFEVIRDTSENKYVHMELSEYGVELSLDTVINEKEIELF